MSYIFASIRFMHNPTASNSNLHWTNHLWGANLQTNQSMNDFVKLVLKGLKVMHSNDKLI